MVLIVLYPCETIFKESVSTTLDSRKFKNISPFSSEIAPIFLFGKKTSAKEIGDFDSLSNSLTLIKISYKSVSLEKDIFCE